MVKLSLYSLVFCLIPAASAQSIQPVPLSLPAPLDQPSWTGGVNQLGQVAGAFWANTSTIQNYIWQGGSTNLFQGGGSTPSAINNFGKVLLNDGSNPSVWANGVVTALPRFSSPIASYTTASGLNDAGEVAGCLTKYIPINIGGIPGKFPVAQLPLLWPASGPAQQVATDVPGTFVCAQALNNSGQVVVNSTRAATGSKAYVWQPGQASRSLGTLGGRGSTTFAWAINDAGQVVGYSAVDSSAVNFHAFLWQNGTMQDLGLPPGAIHSWAFAIDSTGRVLLGSENSRLEQSYWVWKNGLFTQLAGLGSVAFTEGSSAGSIASVGSGAIAASVCPTSSGSVMACIWNLP